MKKKGFDGGSREWEAEWRRSYSAYEIFSRYKVHGGTMSSLIGISLIPTPHACFFHNRSVDEVAKSLVLFKPILEITAIELVDLVGNFGVRNKRIREAGACVVVWLDRNDSRWLESVQAIRQEFGLADRASPPVN